MEINFYIALHFSNESCTFIQQVHYHKFSSIEFLMKRCVSRNKHNSNAKSFGIQSGAVLPESISRTKNDDVLFFFFYWRIRKVGNAPCGLVHCTQALDRISRVISPEITVDFKLPYNSYRIHPDL